MPSWRKAGAIAVFALFVSNGCGDDAELLDGASALCAADDDCDDGLVCSGRERCEAGACRAGLPPSCHDDDPCTRDLCLEPIGCDFVPICELPLDTMDGGATPDASGLPDDAGEPPAEAGPSDAGQAPDASESIPDSGIADCIGPYYVGDLTAVDPSTLEQLRGVQCIIGSLEIRGNRIADLSALRGLRVVTGSLTFARTPRLESLADLDALVQVGQTLSIYRLPGQTELDLFASLRAVGALSIDSISQVERLGGLGQLAEAATIRFNNMPSLRFIAQQDGGPVAERVATMVELSFASLPALQAIAGFGALRSVGSLLLLQLGAVDTSDAFEQLREVQSLQLGLTQLTRWPAPRLATAGSISLFANALTELELDALLAIDSLSIYDDRALARVSLPSITVLRSLSLSRNPALEELRFDALEQITQSLDIRSNAALSPCRIEELIAFTPMSAQRSVCCGQLCGECTSCLPDDDAGALGGDDGAP